VCDITPNHRPSSQVVNITVFLAIVTKVSSKHARHNKDLPSTPLSARETSQMGSHVKVTFGGSLGKVMSHCATDSASESLSKGLQS